MCIYNVSTEQPVKTVIYYLTDNKEIWGDLSAEIDTSDTVRHTKASSASFLIQQQTVLFVCLIILYI